MNITIGETNDDDDGDQGEGSDDDNDNGEDEGQEEGADDTITTISSKPNSFNPDSDPRLQQTTAALEKRQLKKYMAKQLAHRQHNKKKSKKTRAKAKAKTKGKGKGKR